MTSDDRSSNENTYIIDIESGAETARLIEQDKLITHAMGGLFPEQPDLSKVKRILDIGCGPGGWVLEVAFTYRDIDVLGVDINSTMIDYARALASSRRSKNAHFQVTDVTKPLPFPDASFDLINARFIAGFLDKTTWPLILKECMRVLQPQGTIRLTEAEIAFSSSLCLLKLNRLLCQALFLQGRSFSADGQSIGIVHKLTQLLKAAGAEQIDKQPFMLDSSYGNELYLPTYKNNEIIFALLKPYLLAATGVDAVEYEKLYQELLFEMMEADYSSLMFGLTAWGIKPAKVAPESPPDGRRQRGRK